MLLADAVLLGAVGGVEAGFCVGLSRLDTTSTARDASSTCTTGWLNSGAIFTDVCWRLVVAPPISSGIVKPRRSISRATNTISSSDGVIRPLRPIRSALLVDGGLQDPIGRHHDAEIDDLVVVAPENDADDVLADVVDVALHGGQDDLARRSTGRAGPALLLLHVRQEVRDGLLHRAGALDDLRQEHLAGAEQVADDLHAVHQRPLDDVERPRQLQARLLDVLLDEVHDAVDERVSEPLFDRRRRAM